MKKGNLVNFTYGRVGASITGIGLVIDNINNDMCKVLYKGKEYWIHKHSIKSISE
jgi:hypothetical protein